MKTLRKMKAGSYVPAELYNDLVEAVQELQGLKVGPGLEKRNNTICLAASQASEVAATSGVWAKITGSATYGDFGRFRYSWVEVEKTGVQEDGWTEKSGGLSGTTNAYNFYEYILPNAAWEGVPDNSIVWMYEKISVDGATEWWFAHPVISAWAGDADTVTVVTNVNWTGALLQQTKKVLTFTPSVDHGIISIVISEGADSTTTIDTPEAC